MSEENRSQPVDRVDYREAHGTISEAAERLLRAVELSQQIRRHVDSDRLVYISLTHEYGGVEGDDRPKGSSDLEIGYDDAVHLGPIRDAIIAELDRQAEEAMRAINRASELPSNVVMGRGMQELGKMFAVPAEYVAAPAAEPVIEQEEPPEGCDGEAETPET